jgi:hypothetical protein
VDARGQSVELRKKDLQSAKIGKNDVVVYSAGRIHIVAADISAHSTGGRRTGSEGTGPAPIYKV